MNPDSIRYVEKSDEIDITQILLILWNRKRWIFSLTFVFALGGAIYSYIVTPQYYSQATLALKEPGKSGSGASLFSQFGGVGGAVASQLGVGSTNVAKLDIILKSEELAEAVIRKNDLMPVIFYDLWDSTKGDWKSKSSKKIPSVRQGAEVLRTGALVVVSDEKKGLIRIGAFMRDPVLAKKIVDGYLVEINRRIRLNVTADADSNRRYLESQLDNTTDPVLIEKIQGLIAGEIEKTMLISSSAFEVLESPREPLLRNYPRRKVMVGMAAGLGFVLSIAGIFGWMGALSFRKMVSEARNSGLKN